MNKLIFGLLGLFLISSCNNSTQKAKNEKPVFESQLESFNYNPPKPENGKKMGAIVIGSSGLDAFIISVDKMDRWELIQTKFDNSRVIENEATLTQVQSQLNEFVTLIMEEEVRKEDLFIVVSSSASTNNNLKEILTKVQTDIPIEYVSEEEEAIYAYEAVIPEEFEAESFVADIGSGNTKISFLEKGKIQTITTYGSKYYLDSLNSEEVYIDLKSVIGKEIENRFQNCFLIGGVPFLLASNIKKTEERYTIINNLDSIKSTNSKLESGKFIIKAIKEGSNVHNMIFDWESNFVIGFLITKE